MKHKLILLGGIALIVVIGYLFFGTSKTITNYPLKNNGPVVAFGDSLIFGYGSTQGNDFVSILSNKLGEPIINLGVSGNTTLQGLARIDDVLVLKPRITIVLLGGNDFLRKVDRGETFSRLKTIVTRIQESGSAVVLLGVRGGVLIDSVDDDYESLAKETGSVYVSDVLDGLFADGRYMSDAIHPNDAGYALIAEKVYSRIREIIQ